MGVCFESYVTYAINRVSSARVVLHLRKRLSVRFLTSEVHERKFIAELPTLNVFHVGLAELQSLESRAGNVRHGESERCAGVTFQSRGFSAFAVVTLIADRSISGSDPNKNDTK